MKTLKIVITMITIVATQSAFAFECAYKTNVVRKANTNPPRTAVTAAIQSSGAAK